MDRQVLTMPVTRKQYVSAKYLTGLILQGVVLLLTAGAHALQLHLAKSLVWDAYWSDIAMLVVLAVSAPSLILPFIFKNGSEKGRMAYLIVFGTLFALVAAGGVVMDKLGMVVELTELPVGITAVVAAVVLYPTSWALSVHWYGKREL